MRIFQNFERYKNNNAIIYNNSKINYKKLIKKSYNIKKKINKKFIFLILDNTLPSLIAYISLIRLNKILMLADANTNNDEIKKIVNLYKPQIIIHPKKFHFKKEFISKKKFIFENLFVIETSFQTKISKNNKLKLLLPTSGTLGSKKYVKLSSKNLKTNCDEIINYLKIKLTDRCIMNMPLSYSYMISIVNSHLEQGACVCLSDYSITQKNFWKFYKK